MSQTPALLFVAAAALLPQQAFGLQPQRFPARAPLEAPRTGRCSGQKNMQLLSVESSNFGGAIYFDGFLHVGCDIDACPASVRINFKEHAPEPNLPMEPRLCFDFCRTQPSAKFFGLVHGRDCYCTTYFQAQSTGGQGMCDAPCEGDTSQICGGMEKSTLYAMHMCGNSADEAELAQNHSTTALGNASEVNQTASFLAQQLQDLGVSYKSQVCATLGGMCDVRNKFFAKATDLDTAIANLGKAADALTQTSQELASHQGDVVAAANTTGAAASGLELTTDAVDQQASKVDAEAAATKMVVEHVSGPLAQDQLDTLTGEQRQTVTGVFNQLLHVNGSTNGSICALAEIPGEDYAALAAEDDWAGCARRCLSLSTGRGACVAFNFQFRRSGQGRETDSGKRLAACQLLKETRKEEGKEYGLEKVSSSAMAVPVFEVSEDTKHNSFELESLACYAKSGWMAGHKMGPLDTHVIRSV